LTTQPADVELARAALTETQYLTWALRERGLSQRTIAAYRNVSPSTVRDCLDACDLAIRKAKEAA
jgi:uncharacterized protein YpbB